MSERITDERLKRIIGIYEDLYVSETPADYEIELVAKELAILRNQQRKRPPSEKPGDGEVVLTISKTGILNLWTWTGSWGGFGSILDGWWSIKHLVEGK